MADVLKVEPSVLVEFREGPGMSARPRYRPAALDVTVGAEDHAQHATAGVYDGNLSPLYLIDYIAAEFSFCRECGLLVRMFLQIPETPEMDAARIDRWLAEEPVSGAIYLVEPVADYLVKPAMARWCSEREMIMFRSIGERSGAERLRAEVAPGFQLLFADGLLVGWILQEPERCITDLSGQPSTSPPDPALARILRDYLNIMAVPELTDWIIEKDPGFRRSLEEVVDSIHIDQGAADRRAILRNYIVEFIEERL